VDANEESMENLRVNLREQGYDPDRLPLVIQYNKRDLPNVASLAELHALLNRRNVPELEASAATGTGVFETLKAVVKLVLIDLKRGGRQ
jgi:signal recognition particle receptor subunit beta